jgi:hypothetical protein
MITTAVLAGRDARSATLLYLQTISVNGFALNANGQKQH